MITIAAWIVFVCSSIWNIFIVAAIIGIMADKGGVKWNFRNVFDVTLGFAIWFAAGVYIFGWH